MNISKQWILVLVGLMGSVAHMHAFTLKFNNHTIRSLVAKIKVRNIKEESLELPANETVEKSWDVSGFAACTEYIKLRKPNGDVVTPKFLVVNEDRLATLMYHKANREPIDLDELVDLASSTYTGVVIMNSTGVCGDNTLHIFMDMSGNLFMTSLRREVTE